MARYIGNSMRCTQSSMELVSNVIGFDIVELWTEDSSQKLHCTYVHANEALLLQYPDIIVGHHPNHKKEHKLSPKLCELARISSSRYHWRVVPIDDVGAENMAHVAVGRITPDGRPESIGGGSKPPSRTPSPSLPPSLTLHPEFQAPVRTELAYLLESEETGGVNVFIVGFALDRILYSPKKLKFIQGIGFAIFVAAFDLDDNDSEHDEGTHKAELDTKEFMPRPLGSSLNLASVGSLPKSGSFEHASNLGMGVWSVVMEDPEVGLSMTPPQGEATIATNISPLKSVSSLGSMPKPKSVTDLLMAGETSASHATPTPTNLSMPPTWDPVDAFAFPVAEIPVSCVVPDNLQMEHFSDLQHITDGSNANIFLAHFNGEKVIIKMIKEEVQLDQVAVHEFDVEHGMLSRISHPNIIKLKGAGRLPRRFIVLEYLGGGSLSSILSQNQAKPGIAQKLFRRPSFTYHNLLSRAKDMADALEFLNSTCHPGATIIHRDLKPDNVGFTAAGCLKLFDFGLCTCVRRRSKAEEAYEMTGNTGSLRYMAPEVALRKSYNEKADVYSFGIMVWQMARDRVPFKGMTREDFMNLVVRGGERPKLDKSWPGGFSGLLVQCWDTNPLKRPSFAQVSEELAKLLDESSKPAWPASNLGRRMLAGKNKNSERQSTWF